MNIFPAIDLIGGRCVRLTEGDFAQMTVYSADPLEVARQFHADGARFLHVVDLDGAKQRKMQQLALIEQLIRNTPLAVQTGGGIREEAEISALLKAGAMRVVLGSLAVREPEKLMVLADQFGPQSFIIALDIFLEAGKAGEPIARIASHGWQDREPLTLEQCLERLVSDGFRSFLCTDVGRDGKLAGPNFALYRHLQRLYPDIEVQASGGVSSLSDIKELKQMGLRSAIVGKALYENKFTLKECLQC